jgi:hypothetical protein
MAARKQNDAVQRIPAARTIVFAPRPDRGLVDARGKRHRTPVPDEPVDPRLGEPRGKQMGQKSPKNAPRR